MVFIQEITCIIVSIRIYLKKDGTCVINPDEYTSLGTHWIALYMNGINVTSFDSFQVKHIPQETKKIIGNKNITTNIYRRSAYNSIMWEFFCIGFIGFLVRGRHTLPIYFCQL